MPPEENLFQQDPTGTGGEPNGGTPPDPNKQADPTTFTQADIDLARERARADTLQDLIDKGKYGERQADPTGTQDPFAGQPPLPDNPLDLLPAAERQKLIDSAQLDPVSYSNTVSTLAAKLTEMKLQRQAAPLIMSQARTIVDMFEDKMGRREVRQDLVTAISREFRTLLAGKDLRPLINLPDAQREEELVLRWETARNRALIASPTPPAPPKPDPTLIASGGGGGGPSPGTKRVSALDIPGIAAMHKKRPFSKEQLEAIEEEANV